MRYVTTLLSLIVCAALAGSTYAQQAGKAAQALQARYGPNYEEVLSKYGDQPERLRQAELDYQNSLQAEPFFYSALGSGTPGDYIVREETEPNDFFDTADDIDDVLGTPTPWAPDYGVQYRGGLIKATFTAGDFDVYSFTGEEGIMYYFASSHSYPGTENFDDGTLGVSARLFHESDLDTSFVVGFRGIADNDQIAGDILGESTDHRANSGDFRLTGWTVPIDEATGEAVTGTFYLFIFNGVEEDVGPIKSLGGTGTYHLGAYAVDMEPLVSRYEPNQTFEEALLNPNSALPLDAVVRQGMAFNPDTVKVVINDVTGGIPYYLPYQSNSVYAQLLAQGDEDIDLFAINGLKADHTLVIETLPFFGYYRDIDGSVGPGDTRWTDTLIRLFNADFTSAVAESDDANREVQSTNGSPNNIHSRIVYEVQPTDVGAPMWFWMAAWASHTRDPGQSVNNRDPGRFVYRFYAYQYANDLVEANSEPNDTFEDAMGIAPRSSEAVTGNFSSGGDVDVFRIFLHEQRIYDFASYNSTVTGPIGIEIFHETEDLEGAKSMTGDLLAGTGAVGAEDNDFRVSGFIPPASGAYLIRLTAPSAGDYSFAAFDAVIFQRLVYNEPDDTAEEAAQHNKILVGVGQPRQEGLIYPEGDVDHYRFDGLAGQQANVKLQSLGNAVFNDTFQGVVRILDGSGSVVATGTPSADAMSALSYTLPADGTYTIQVAAAAGTTAGDYGNNAVGAYSLNVGEPPREAEPNDTPANATLLLEGFLAGSMTVGDVDYYRISTQAGNIYHIRSLNNDTGGAMDVDLFLASDPNTSIHDGSDWAGRYSDDNFKVQILPAQDAVYLLKLTGSGSGEYEVHLKSNDITSLSGAFEPNDDIDEASGGASINPDGQVHQAMLYNADDPRFFDDVDYYRIDIEDAGKTLSCETLPFDGALWGRDSDMYTILYDAAGNELFRNDDNSVTLEDGTIWDDWHSRSSHTVTEAGTYYCAIGSQDFLDDDDGGDDRDPTSGEYKFRVSYVGEEAEPNDTFATASLITAQGSTNATFAAAGELDIFSFDLKAGNIYHIRTFRGDGMGELGARLSTGAAPGVAITTPDEGGWQTRNNGGNIKLNIIPDEDQTYYLEITAPTEIGDGTYQVIMKTNPIAPLSTNGEPNNTFDEADAQAEHPFDGELYEYMLYDSEVEGFHDDLDYYWVDAQVGNIIVGETHPFDSGELWPRDFDAYMYLYGPDRSLITSDDDGGFDWHSKIEHTAETAGRYYFLVIGQDAAVAPRNQAEDRWVDPARGEYKFSLTKIVGVDVEETGEVPEEFALNQNYPNPFNPTTTISYQLPEAAEVQLEVYNLLGQRVRLLVDDLQAAGSYRVQFRADDLASGMYLYRIQAGRYVEVKTMVLIK